MYYPSICLNQYTSKKLNSFSVFSQMHSDTVAACTDCGFGEPQTSIKVLQQYTHLHSVVFFDMFYVALNSRFIYRRHKRTVIKSQRFLTVLMFTILIQLKGQKAWCIRQLGLPDTRKILYVICNSC